MLSGGREAVKTVWQTANLVRKEGFGAAVRSSIEDPADWPNARVTVETTPGGGVTIVIPGHENVTLPHEMAHAVKVEKV